MTFLQRLLSVARGLLGPPNVRKLKENGDVEGLIQLITDGKDNNVRQKAAEALRQIGDVTGLTLFVDALESADITSRERAAEALGWISDPRAVEPLIAVLKDDDRTVRRKAAQALGQISDARALEALIAALKDKDETVRQKAIGALGQIGDAQAVGPVIAICNDKAGRLRSVAAAALGQIGDMRAAEPLIAALEDEDGDVRREAAKGLLALRLRNMDQLDESRYMAKTFISHAEYQVFLDERRMQGEYHHPDHWRGSHFPEGEGYMPVVGVRCSDAVAFCEWLTQRESDEWGYRLPTVGELGPSQVSRNEEPGLPTEVGFWALTENDECVLVNTDAVTIEQATLERWLLSDLKEAWKLVHDCKTIYLGRRERDLGLDREFARACEFAIELASDLDGAHDILAEIDRRSGSSSVYETRLSIELGQDNYRDRALRRLGSLAYELTRIQQSRSGCFRTKTFHHARRLAREIGADLSAAGESASSLDRVDELIATVSHIRVYSDFDPALNHALHLTLDVQRTRIREITRVLVRELDRFCGIADELGLEYGLILGKDVKHVLGKTWTNTPNLDRQPGLDRELNRFVNNFVKSLPGARSAFALELAHQHAFLLASADHLALNRRGFGSIDANWRQILCLLRRYARISALALVFRLSDSRPWFEKRVTSSTDNRVREAQKLCLRVIDELIEMSIGLYVESHILEDRIQGKLPVIEGISIVRERKTLR